MSWYFWLIFFPLIDVFLSVENENVGWDFWCISFPIILVLNGLSFGGLGGWFGTQRNRRQVGFWLGFFFGPSGWLLTLLLPPGTARTIPEQSGFGHCPTCGGILVGRFPKCSHCASDVFWAGRVPTRTAQEAADEQQRQEQLAAERQRQIQEESERASEARRRWEEQKSEALHRGKYAARAALCGLMSGTNWLLRMTDQILRRLSRRGQEVRVRRVFVPTRRRVRKADKVLRDWTERLKKVNEAGKGR